MIVGIVCMLCAGLAFLAKCGLFWWAVVLRFSLDGRVAAGKMIPECFDKHQVIDEVDGADTSNDTNTDASGRILAETDSVTGMPVCDDMDAFQIRSGKLLL